MNVYRSPGDGSQLLPKHAVGNELIETVVFVTVCGRWAIDTDICCIDLLNEGGGFSVYFFSTYSFPSCTECDDVRRLVCVLGGVGTASRRSVDSCASGRRCRSVRTRLPFHSPNQSECFFIAAIPSCCSTNSRSTTIYVFNNVKLLHVSVTVTIIRQTFQYLDMTCSMLTVRDPYCLHLLCRISDT